MASTLTTTATGQATHTSSSDATAALPLLGKVALVTGGSRGIGAAIARRLARDGADVVVTYARGADKARAVAEAIEKDGRRARAIEADGANPAAVEASIAQAVAAFGRLDILVNNAGIFIGKPFGDYSVEDYDQLMAVNVRAVFLASQAASRHMGQGGRIITIGSTLGERVWGQQMTLYSLSKSALISFNKGVARDLGPRGITANLVQPGSTETDMNPATGDFADKQRSLMAIPVYGTADGVAALVAYLASPEAQSVTGATFTIDGGANA